MSSHISKSLAQLTHGLLQQGRAWPVAAARAQELVRRHSTSFSWHRFLHAPADHMTACDAMPSGKAAASNHEPCHTGSLGRRQEADSQRRHTDHIQADQGAATAKGKRSSRRASCCRRWPQGCDSGVSKGFRRACSKPSAWKDLEQGSNRPLLHSQWH